MIDSNQPGPFADLGQMGRRCEVPEFLEDVDFFLETVPETRPQRLNRFDMTMLFLSKFRGEGIVSLTGGTRRTGWTRKVSQGLHDGVGNRLIVFRNQDGKFWQPAGQLLQVTK